MLGFEAPATEFSVSPTGKLGGTSAALFLFCKSVLSMSTGRGGQALWVTPMSTLETGNGSNVAVSEALLNPLGLIPASSQHWNTRFIEQK
ncbi:unnamed protein product [Lota lota]